MHNFLTRDGTPPAELYAAGRAEVGRLFRQLTPYVTMLRHTAAEQAGQLSARGIPVIDGLVAQVETGEDHLTGVRLADGTRVALDALVVAPKFVANAGLLASFGLAPVEVNSGGQVIAARIEADPGGATSVPGDLRGRQHPTSPIRRPRSSRPRRPG